MNGKYKIVGEAVKRIFRRGAMQVAKGLQERLLRLYPFDIRSIEEAQRQIEYIHFYNNGDPTKDYLVYGAHSSVSTTVESKT